MLTDCLLSYTTLCKHIPIASIYICREACVDCSVFAARTAESLCLNFLFCQHGHLTLEVAKQDAYTLSSQDILILSNKAAVRHLLLNHLSGVLVAIDVACKQSDLCTLCALMGKATPNLSAIEHHLRTHDGYTILHHNLQTQLFFSNLEKLSQAEQSEAALWKSLELLDPTDAFSAKSTLRQTPSVALANEVASYMRQHLDESLTISTLSVRFNASPTTLKKAFRQHFGQPIHAWLLEQRLQHAAFLLCNTSLSILDIAQEVGYRSVSQFSNAFSQYYGLPPGKYRKHSV